ncbi:MAG: STAS domain-containing protein [bacterium]
MGPDNAPLLLKRNDEIRLAVVTFPDNLDAYHADQYRKQLFNLIEEGYPNLALDFQHVLHITSSGLGLLVALHARVVNNEGRLALLNMSGYLKRLLREAQLDQLLTHISPGPQDELHGMDIASDYMSKELCQQAIFNRTAAELLSESEPNEVARKLLRGMTECFQVERALFLRPPRDEAGNFTLTEALGYSQEDRERMQAFLNVNPASSFSALGVNLLSVHTAGDVGCPKTRELMILAGLEKAVITPLVGERRRFGAMLLGVPNRDEFSLENSLYQLRSFSSLASLALEKLYVLSEYARLTKDMEGSLLENQRLQSHLLEAGKIAMAGSLMSGVVDTFNNKLMPVLGYIELLLDSPTLSPEHRRQVQTVGKAGAEFKQLLDSLIQQTRQKKLRLETVALKEIVDGVLLLTKKSFEDEGITVKVDWAGKLPALQLDRELTEQALLSLLQRARSLLMGRDVKEISLRASLRDGRVWLHYRDTAKNPPQEEQTLLDPLQQIHIVGEKCVFNLGLLHSVVQSHLGELRVLKADQDGTELMIGWTVP